MEDLLAMGFSENSANMALQASNNGLQRAIDILFHNIKKLDKSNNASSHHANHESTHSNQNHHTNNTNNSAVAHSANTQSHVLTSTATSNHDADNHHTKKLKLSEPAYLGNHSTDTTLTAHQESHTSSSSTAHSHPDSSSASASFSTTGHAPASGGTTQVTYMECHEGNSSKFYCLIVTDSDVTIKYGKCDTDGVTAKKSFPIASAALKFVEKTVIEKEHKGYHSKAAPAYITCGQPGGKPASAPDGTTPHEDDSDEKKRADLESGLKVYFKGSSALRYTCKRFDGGYSCTCQGWTMNVKNKGIQATSCKHLKQIRGEAVELARCSQNAGTLNPSQKGVKLVSIPGKISLAHPWKQSIDPTGYVMSEKLDGMRAYWDGQHMYSRSGLRIITPAWFTAGLPTDLELDGELFMGRKMFEQCMSITRRNDAGGDWTKITYIIFDAPTVSGGIRHRLEAAEAALAASETVHFDLPKLPARVHPHTVCSGVAHLLEELTAVEAMGGEGMMLRHATAPHRGGRTHDLLKVKTFHDDEALVLDYEDGHGKHQGKVGALVCVNRSGAHFKVGSGLTDHQREHNHAPPRGSIITFKYFELSADGIPRFPTYMRLRPDVEPDEFPQH